MMNLESTTVPGEIADDEFLGGKRARLKAGKAEVESKQVSYGPAGSSAQGLRLIIPKALEKSETTIII